MTPLQVHKFGGTSVGDPSRMRAVAAIVREQALHARIIVVASAMSGVTDALIDACVAASHGERDRALQLVDTVLERHQQVLETLVPAQAQPVGESLRELARGTQEVLQAVARLRELTARTRDLVLCLGEKLSVRVLAAVVANEGLPATALDADAFLDTDACFGQAAPLAGVTHRSIDAALSPLVAKGLLPVVTGFLGRAPDGATTTLGRGGSDYSATLIGAAVGASEITIWTDVDGVYTANPKVVPHARRLEQLNFREAGELSYYGAKVLHPRTIIPVAARAVPVRIRNSFDPRSPGTLVDGRFTAGSHPVKAISAVHEQALVAIEGKGMAHIPGVAARVFAALAQAAISVTMISQSSSESSICLAVSDVEANAAELALRREFRRDISSGLVDDITVQRRVGLVAAVGLGMAHTPGVSGRLFAALGKRGVNVLAIAQGSSELNISLAVARHQIDDAVRAIHEAFALHRLDTGEDTTGRLDVLLLGWGKIGRALSHLLTARRDQVLERFGLEPRIVGICDRSGFVFRPNGLPADLLQRIVTLKSEGQPLANAPEAVPSGDARAMLRHALGFRLARPVLVDVSDSDDSHAVMLEAFALGCDVVTANKKPLAGPFDQFLELRAEAMRSGRVLKAEATVGAGLPVIDTLEVMQATGDRITMAQGCLSGTLAFVISQLEAGVALSQAVEQARALGYTEPDPMVDLCGGDVARKAVILGRLAALVNGQTSLTLQGLVDASWVGLPASEWRARLQQLDEPMARRVSEARAQGKVLRYVATVLADSIEVGLQPVEPDSPLGLLRGTDNMIVFQSERYNARPLVISGPGAGIDVTAMGVMGDILRIAAERR